MTLLNNYPSVRIRVNEVISIDGTRIIRSGKRLLNVSMKVASSIWVKDEKRW